MLIAGSLVALLLMGFAVDGLLPSGNEKDDDDPNTDGMAEDEFADQSGTPSSALSDLLFSGTDGGAGQVDDQAAESNALPLANASSPAQTNPQDDWQADGQDREEHGNQPGPIENIADTAWQDTAALTAAAGDFLEVDETTTLPTGEAVAYVETFHSSTDALILEFDGTRDDAPMISIDLQTEQDAALVLANGVPVTLVEGATDLTADHIRVVMSGEPAALALPSATGAGDPFAELDAKPDLGDGPQVMPALDAGADISLPDDVPGGDTITALLDGIAGLPTGPGSTSDMLDARSAIDDAFGTGGDDALTAGAHGSFITGGAGPDAMFGNDGNDTLLGGAGNDELHGDGGHDDLQGGAGIDFLSGGAGNDTLDGGGDRDLLFGGDGDDVLHGGAQDDVLQGGFGADTLNGGSGNDLLDGTFGSGGMDGDSGDILWGGDGDDTILVGQGDTAHGGAGSDTFIGGAYIQPFEIAGSVTDFDPFQDRIEVIFDPELDPNPVLEVHDFADGTGADIILNGEIILSVTGAQGLDPNLIDLRAAA